MEKYLLNIDARQAKDKWRLNKRKVRYELTHWKRLWCWEGLGAGGEGDDRGWDGWMASLTRWTWVWVNSGSWWWTGRPGVLRFMGSQRVRHDWATELNWTEYMYIRRAWQPTPVFLPGESHGQKSLASYSPWGRKSWTLLSTIFPSLLWYIRSFSANCLNSFVE